MSFADDNLISNIGINYFIDEAVINGKKYIFKIIDTAGAERYISITGSSIIKKADGFLLVFSVHNRNSLNNINYWIENIVNNVDRNKKVQILVGNKIDIKEREVTNEEAINFAKEKNMKYFEISAKTGFGIKKFFNEIYQEIVNINININNELFKMPILSKYFSLQNLVLIKKNI